MVTDPGDNENDGYVGFDFCFVSLLLLMLSLEMTKTMAMKACCVGGVVALAFVFSFLLTVSFPMVFSTLPLSLLFSSSLSLFYPVYLFLSFFPYSMKVFTVTKG